MAKEAPVLMLTETIKTTTSRERRFVLRGEQIRRLLGEVGVEVPDDADIYMSVPGGGDWSNTKLPIDEANGLVVSFTEQDTTEESSTSPWEVTDGKSD